jgi:hypothetical protein
MRRSAPNVFLCDKRHFRPSQSTVRKVGAIRETDHEREDPRAVPAMVAVIAGKTQAALSLVRPRLLRRLNECRSRHPPPNVPEAGLCIAPEHSSGASFDVRLYGCTLLNSQDQIAKNSNEVVRPAGLDLRS